MEEVEEMIVQGKIKKYSEKFEKELDKSIKKEILNVKYEKLLCKRECRNAIEMDLF